MAATVLRVAISRHNAAHPNNTTNAITTFLEVPRRHLRLSNHAPAGGGIAGDSHAHVSETTFECSSHRVDMSTISGYTTGAKVGNI